MPVGQGEALCVWEMALGGQQWLLCVRVVCLERDNSGSVECDELKLKF